MAIEKFGKVTPKTVDGRFKLGWPVEEAILTPVKSLTDKKRRKN